MPIPEIGAVRLNQTPEVDVEVPAASCPIEVVQVLRASTGSTPGRSPNHPPASAKIAVSHTMSPVRTKSSTTSAITAFRIDTCANASWLTTLSVASRCCSILRARS